MRYLNRIEDEKYVDGLRQYVRQLEARIDELENALREIAGDFNRDAASADGERVCRRIAREALEESK